MSGGAPRWRPGPEATTAVALAQAAEVLRASGVPGPARDARRLMAHALGIAPGGVTLALDAPLGAAAADRLAQAVAARAARQPLAQITGLRSFWRHDFIVTADVLDPRPETETLIAAALERGFSRLLDLGTGSGCILLSLLAERPAATGLGTDISAPALAVARRNAERLGLQGRAEFLRADWGRGVPGTYDLVVSNPPYIAAAEMGGLAPEVRMWEPAWALSPGGDGLGAYRAIARDLPRLVAPGGAALVEIGPTQAGAVSALMCGAGLPRLALCRDLDGRARALLAGRA